MRRFIPSAEPKLTVVAKPSGVITTRTMVKNASVNTAEATEDSSEDAAKPSIVLPQHPGTDVKAHAAQTYMEKVEAILASHSLLAVAQGHEHPSASCIMDIDLDTIPPLPNTHRDHSRREELRIKVDTQNRVQSC